MKKLSDQELENAKGGMPILGLQGMHAENDLVTMAWSTWSSGCDSVTQNEWSTVSNKCTRDQEVLSYT